ncbi:MAG: GNAT family N-acetyltransferase, partial [Spirochaetia bacterium]|nr:GNAT family N-acetyltransferase [Spirochaetia bacterium]
INEWYNNLREIWGLERLEQLCESDDTSVYDDFSFREYNPSSDKKMLLLQVEPDSCCCEKLPFEVNNAIYEKLYTDFEKDDSENQIGFVCFSHSDEFAGCITVSQMAKKQKDVMIMTGIFVPEQFRGLGICTELIQMCVSKLQTIGKKWIFIPDLFVPEILQPLLIRTGFEKIYSGYILDLNMA